MVLIWDEFQLTTSIASLHDCELNYSSQDPARVVLVVLASMSPSQVMHV